MSDSERDPRDQDLTQPPAPPVTRVNRKPLLMAGTLLLFAFLVGLQLTSGRPTPTPPASAAASSPPTEDRLSALLREAELRARSRQRLPARSPEWSPAATAANEPGDSSEEAEQPARTAPPLRSIEPGVYNPEAAPAPSGWGRSPAPSRPAPVSQALVRYRANDGAGRAEAPPQDENAGDPLESLRSQLSRMVPLAAATSASGSAASSAGAQLAANPAASPAPRSAQSAGPATLRLTPPGPAGAVVLFQGSLIPATLEADIVSDLPGSARAVVRQDVYDSLSGRRLLIPQGSRLIGQYNSAVAYGDSRLLLVWRRLLLPDGSSYLLDSMPATDPAGAAGLAGNVNNHWGRLLGSALLLSAISAGAQLSQTPHRSETRATPTASEIAAAALGQELSSLSSSIVRRELQVKPTLRVEAGTLFHVETTADLYFPEN